MHSIADRIDAQRERIERACQRAGRVSSDVTLVAVSKTHPVDSVAEAAAHGLRDFGESYAPELRTKVAAIENVRWHFIGHLQSNKAPMVGPHAAVVHSVDRLKIARALASRVPGRRQLDLMVQVNVSAERSKSGCSPDEVDGLVDAIGALDGVRCVGLMTMAPFGSTPEEARPVFSTLRRLRDAQRERLLVVDAVCAEAFAHLSMGMSGDAEVAIEEGATMVRIGSAIFGARGAA